MTKLILAVDLDGVILPEDNYRAGEFNGPLAVGTVDALRRLHGAGHTLFIFTARKDLRAVERWATLELFPAIGFEMRITNVKTFAHHIIDDHGYHHRDWETTLKDILC